MADHWRRALARAYDTRLVGMTFSRLSCLGNGGVAFPSGLSAIVGANGVGKSTLVAALHELLNGTRQGSPPEYRQRTRGSTLEGTMLVERETINMRVEEGVGGTRLVTGTGFEGGFRWLDASSAGEKCLQQMHSDDGFFGVLEGVTPLAFDDDELTVAGYLTGKQYLEILAYEVEDYGGVDRFPYFRVSSGGVSYGSEAMGRGEFSLLLTYWTLKDLPKDSIIVIEEPETHVSPQSQSQLMNLVAKFCDEKGLWVVIATHSPTIISRLPEENLILLASHEGTSAQVTEVRKTQLATLLGGGVAFGGILLVEDVAAKEFLMLILQTHASELFRQFEVASAKGASRITCILQTVPMTAKWLTLVGVYDGDQRKAINQEELTWPCVFLPGNVSPEELLRSAIALPQSTVKIAYEIGRHEEEVRVAVGAAQGADLHDYFARFAQSLAVDVQVVRRSFGRLWLGEEANREAAVGLVADIRKAINSAHRNA